MSAQDPVFEALGTLGQESDVVQCAVCDAEIDAVTGDALSPITEQNVAAVQQYMTSAGMAEEGGVPLVEPFPI